MEDQGRMFLAIALSFLVFIVWSYFFGGNQEDENIGRTLTQREDIVKDEEVKNDIDKTPIVDDLSGIHNDKKGLIPDNKSNINKYTKTDRYISVNTPLYSIKISENKATFESFVLRKYKESIEEDSNLKEMIYNHEKKALQQDFVNHKLLEGEGVVFSSDHPSDTLDVSDDTKSISFSWTNQNGVTIQKKYSFSSKEYLVGLNISIFNKSDKQFTDDLVIYLNNFDSSKIGRLGFEGPCTLIGKKLEKVKIKKIEEKDEYDGKLKWIAVQDRYFISSLIPKKNVDSKMKLHLRDDQILETMYILPNQQIPPGAAKSYDFEIFMGPKSVKMLKGFGYDLDKAVNFGFFDFIAKPCLWLMNYIYDNILANYGVAIIILTILIKILFWPLGTKSYKSMNDMKKLQPLMEEIREKFKDDKKKMNEEIMGLYKTYKINPLGGCLPMVAQIPVFFALYQMLYGTIELRHAPFFGWIKDLSAPDRLFAFDFAIPFMDPPSGIPVLTIIMGGTMFLQQKLSPPPGDPTQAKMMMFMPIIFTVIFINFSSGLVLYWLVQNSLSIAQQYYISKKK